MSDLNSQQLRVVGNGYQLGDQPFQILAGAIHYFRMVPEQWTDSLRKLKALGLNTVETYVCWNLHESEPGQWNFEGRLDIVEFIRQAEALRLKVIVRPGPYICSEWDFGGLPAWLLRDPAMRVRCCYPPYLAAVDRYLEKLLPLIAPLQSTRGGPVIAVQIENEYGGFGNDRKYLEHLRDKNRALDIDSFLFTSDHGAYLDFLPDLFKTANFGSKPAENFATLRKFQPTGPLTCMEFWCGWFDSYGQERPARDTEELAAVLDEMLQMGASFCFYMFHGGTNFGFLNGANCDEKSFDPRPTSYDYGALLDEAGGITPKYDACRRVMEKHGKATSQQIFAPAPCLELPRFATSGSAPLFDVLPQLSSPITNPTPLPMEQVGQNYGFILYRTQLHGRAVQDAPLWLRGVRDRAWIFLDGKPLGVIERDRESTPLNLTAREGAQLDILVENMGRTNYGIFLLDPKGLLDGAVLDRKFLFDWTIHPLPLEPLPKISFQPGANPAGPAFHEVILQIEDPQNTFLDLSDWTKGCCFLNGFNLGRYWNRGPHQSLFIPKPLLKKGENHLVIFELEKPGDSLQLRAQPIFKVR